MRDFCWEPKEDLVKHLHPGSKALLFVIFLTPAFSQCTSTGFMRDGMNLTAALINPPGTVAGDVDATGCDIGIYYDQATTFTVEDAAVHNANAFGIVNNGANVTIQNSSIHTIGLTNTFDDQGYGIYFAIASNSAGSITGNTVSDYRVAGIVVNGGLGPTLNPQVGIISNVVTGSGPNRDVAQTGIQYGFGAFGNVRDNTVTSIQYTGLDGGLGVGILAFGGACYASLPSYDSPPISNLDVTYNILIGDDLGIALYNLDAACNVLPAPQANTLSDNLIQKYGRTNKTGWSVTPPEGYQAGIQDAGSGDTISFNTVCGHGYAPNLIPPPHIHYIDHATAINPIVAGNITARSCIGVPPASAAPTASVSSDAQDIQETHGPSRPVVRY
jgi:hypothetical protein